MNGQTRILIALAGSFFAQNALTCEQPSAISVPDGSTATEQDMNDAGRAYHNFMVEMQLYQVCLDDEAEQDRRTSDKSSKEQIRARENRHTSRHNAASAEMEKTTEAFNKAISEYKATQ